MIRWNEASDPAAAGRFSRSRGRGRRVIDASPPGGNPILAGPGPFPLAARRAITSAMAHPDEPTRPGAGRGRLKAGADGGKAARGPLP